MASLWIRRCAAVGMIVLAAAIGSRAQKAAVLAPNGTDLDKAAVAVFMTRLASKIHVQDADMSWAAYAAVKPQAPFNMTADDARRLGSSLGCDVFMLLNSDTRRRASIDGPDRFESYSTIYVINARTGLLAFWKIISASAASPDEAREQLLKLIPTGANDVLDAIRDLGGSARTDAAPNFELPEPGSPEAKNFRAPIPYRRLSPEYTRLAYLYDVTATVEATVDLDELGQITNMAITRWAGFELDESVAKAVRSMNWRPAERNGKPLPVRFLLRYNFKKIEKDDPDNE